MFLFHRSFWRLIALSTAFSAAAYLARSLRQQSMPALPAPPDTDTRPRGAKRAKRAPMATTDAAADEVRNTGNGRTAH